MPGQAMYIHKFHKPPGKRGAIRNFAGRVVLPRLSP